MNKIKGKSLKTLFLGVASVGMFVSISGCATTTTMTVKEAAPISYKVGEGDSSYASLRQPEPSGPPATTLPYTAPPQSPLAVPQNNERVSPEPRKSANLGNIDRNLYSHMKVGKPYKVAGKTYYPKHNPDYDQVGVASWYGQKFHGKPTANGEIYNKNALTAAHPTLALNSFVYVTNLENGKTITVRLNDRGPFIDGRIIDLSEAAAKAVGLDQTGLGRVRVQYAGAAPKPAPKSSSASRAPSTQSPAVPAPVMPEIERPNVTSPSANNGNTDWLESYRPMRDGGSTVAFEPNEQANQFTVPDIMGPPTNGSDNSSTGIALPQSRNADLLSMPPIPEPTHQGGDEDIVTLTIKGPVHMAGTKVNTDEAELIPASYEEEK